MLPLLVRSTRKGAMPTDEPFCGLHGCTRVDPNGKQQNLDHDGGCGFIPKHQPEQLTILFDC